jgi:hypothetical protein
MDMGHLPWHAQTPVGIIGLSSASLRVLCGEVIGIAGRACGSRANGTAERAYYFARRENGLPPGDSDAGRQEGQAGGKKGELCNTPLLSG